MARHGCDADARNELEETDDEDEPEENDELQDGADWEEVALSDGTKLCDVFWECRFAGGNVIPEVDNSHSPCAAAVMVAGVGDVSWRGAGMLVFVRRLIGGSWTLLCR